MLKLLKIIFNKQLLSRKTNVGSSNEKAGENSIAVGRGARNYEILSATMVGRRRKLLISNRLKGLEKLNIYWRRVM